jgi:hypothetical protein
LSLSSLVGGPSGVSTLPQDVSAVMAMAAKMMQKKIDIALIEAAAREGV